MDVDSFEDLAIRAEFPAPAFHIELLRAQTQLLRERPEGVSYFAIGTVAMASLTEEQRSEAYVLMIGHYATGICCEHNDQENAERLERDAADPATTYLGDIDVGILWDAVLDGKSESTECNREVLMNVLSELELLQHRLAMSERERAST